MATWFTARDPYTSRKQKVLYWPAPFGIPEKIKELDAWLKKDPVLFGTLRSGERWHKEQAEAFLAEYCGGIMRWVNEKYGRKDLLSSNALLFPNVARSYRMQEEAEVDVEDDSASVMSSADSGARRAQTLLAVRALFAKDPHGTNVRGLDPLVASVLTMMRETFDQALCYFSKDVVCSRLHQSLSLMYQHDQDLSWSDIHEFLLTDLEDEPLRYYQEELATMRRRKAEQLHAWLDRFRSIAEEHQRLTYGDGDNEVEPAYVKMLLDYALGQCTNEEKLFLKVPNEQVQYVKLTLRTLRTRASKVLPSALKSFYTNQVSNFTKRMLTKPDNNADAADTKPVKTPGKNPRGDGRRKAAEQKKKADEKATQAQGKRTKVSWRDKQEAKTLKDAKARTQVKKEATDQKEHTVAAKLLFNAMKKRMSENKCIRCGKEGHIRTKCDKQAPTHERDALRVGRLYMMVESDEEEVSGVYAVPSEGRALLCRTKLMVGGKTELVAAVIDTGAGTINLADASVIMDAEEHGMKIEMPNAVKRVKGIGGIIVPLSKPGVVLVCNDLGGVDRVVVYESPVPLPGGAKILFGMPAIYQLPIDVNGHLFDAPPRAMLRRVDVPVDGHTPDAMVLGHDGTTFQGVETLDADVHGYRVRHENGTVAWCQEIECTKDRRAELDGYALLSCDSDDVAASLLFQTDLQEVFSGGGALTKAVKAKGRRVMRPLDILHGDDLTDAETVRKAVRDIDASKPAVGFLAYPCVAYSAAQRMNAKSKSRTEAAELKREVAKKVAKETLPLIEAVLRNGGEIVIENPTSSKFWKSEEFQHMQEAVKAHGKSLRLIGHDQCMYRSDEDPVVTHKKPTTFATTISQEHTAGVELKCSHGKRVHTPCRGRTGRGRSRTKATSAYTTEQAKAWATVIARVATIPRISAGRKAPQCLMATCGEESAAGMRWCSSEHMRKDLESTQTNMRSALATWYSTVAPVCCLASCERFVEAGECPKNKGYHKAACCLNHYSEAKLAGQRIDRSPLADGEEELSSVMLACEAMDDVVLLVQEADLRESQEACLIATMAAVEAREWCDDVCDPVLLAQDSSLSSLFYTPRVRPIFLTDEDELLEQQAHDFEEEEYVLLAERELQRYLTFDLRSKKPRSWQDISICETMPLKWKDKFDLLHEECAEVFDIPVEGLTRPLRGVEPVEFPFVDKCKPFYCPEPRWKPAEAEVLYKYYKAKCDSGECFHNAAAGWAARPHIAKKRVHGEPKDGIFEVRPCVDMSRTNPQYKRMVPNYPAPMVQIQGHAGYYLYASSDAHGQFNSIRVKPGRSQDSQTVWVPRIGKVTSNVLVFGNLNGATIAQGIYRKFAVEDLSEDAQRERVSFQDDFSTRAGKAEDGPLVDEHYADLYRRWRENVMMCKKRGITLSPHKTHIGYHQTIFYGYEIDKDGHRQTEANLDPIKKCVAPENVPELRSVMGMFVQGMSRIEKYAMIAKPLHELLRKGIKWQWDEGHEAAFRDIQNKLIARPVLRAPDYTKPFYAYPDASDDGKGATLCQEEQEPEGERPEWLALIPHHRPQRIIQWWSKAWNDRMRRMPVYYREADALFWCIEKSKVYTECSVDPLTVRCDQQPLKWVRHSAKGKVTQWRADKAMAAHYIVEYFPGPKNLLGDAPSRYPMLGPKTLTRLGLDFAFRQLLEFIPSELKEEKNCWVYAGRDTTALAQVLQRWRTPKGAIRVRAPKLNVQYDAGMHYFVVTPEKAPMVAQKLLAGDKAGAVLLPSDLVYTIYTDERGEVDTDLHRCVKNAAKLSLMAPGLTWLVHRAVPEDVELHRVLLESTNVGAGTDAGPEADTPDKIVPESITPPAVAGWLREKVGSYEDWAKATPSSLASEKLTKSADIAIRQTGLALYAPEERAGKVYLPLKVGDDAHQWRREMIDLVHKNIGHLADAKTGQELRRTYWWPSMTRDVRVHIAECGRCNLSKGRRRVANKSNRAVVGGGPRTRWAFDFYGVHSGEILNMIDIDSGWWIPVYLPNRSAVGVRRVFLRDVRYQFGVPQEVLTDDAPELIGKVMTLCEKQLGVIPKKTHGYHPRGNATVERTGIFMGECLRAMTDEQYADIENELPRMAWEHNIHVRETTGVSPYQIMYGAEPPTCHGALAVSEEGKMATPGEIATQAAEYRAVALAMQTYNLQRTADALNRKGHKRSYEIGDRVKYFAPPSAKQAKDRQRKVKHLFAWHGPCRVIAKEGTTYRMRHEETGKTRTRTLINIDAWKGTTPVTTPVKKKKKETNQIDLEDVQIGEFIAVLDAVGDMIYHVAEVLDVSEHFEVHYFGTQQAKLKGARFYPIRVIKGSDDIVFRALRKTEKGSDYTGEVPIDTDMIICTGLQFTGASSEKRGFKLTSSSVKKLQSTKLVHHVY